MTTTGASPDLSDGTPRIVLYDHERGVYVSGELGENGFVKLTDLDDLAHALRLFRSGLKRRGL